MSYTNVNSSRSGPAVLAERLPALDGVRGIAILAVMLFHFRWVFEHLGGASQAAFAGLSFGWMGVDLFFALSGFLITRILVATRDRANYFQAFYLRRALRIFPLYYLYLFLILVAVRAVYVYLSSQPDPWASLNPWRYIFYFANFQPGAHGADDMLLPHLWSLCIEEQFYFVWPAVVWFVPSRYLLRVCFAVAVVACVLRVAILAGGGSHEASYRLLFCRMDGLALGGAAAVIFDDPALRHRVASWQRTIIGASLGLLIAVVIANGGLNSDASIMQTAGFPLISVLSAMCVLGAAGLPFAGWLNTTILRTAGKYSYAMYVFHIPLDHYLSKRVVAFSALWPAWQQTLCGIAYVTAMTGLMFAVGWLSWTFFESPILRWKDRAGYVRRPASILPEPAAARAR